MLTQALRDLVKAAESHARRDNDDEAGRVATALLTSSGRTILGPNSSGTTDAPNSEASALAEHAATCPDDDVVAIATVDGATGEVIAPGGATRQALFDLDPEIQCVVRSSAGLEPMTIAELLPHAHDPRTAGQPQKISMWEGYEPIIRDGSKRQTIRIDDPFRPGPAQLVFEKSDGEAVTIAAHVTEVTPCRCRDLTEEQALRDGFSSLEELHQALDKHYPGLSRDAMADVVTFELTE